MHSDSDPVRVAQEVAPRLGTINNLILSGCVTPSSTLSVRGTHSSTFKSFQFEEHTRQLNDYRSLSDSDAVRVVQEVVPDCAAVVLFRVWGVGLRGK